VAARWRAPSAAQIAAALQRASAHTAPQTKETA